jgi:hypothetical protein
MASGRLAVVSRHPSMLRCVAPKSIPTRSAAHAISPIDIQQAIRNPYRTAITVDHTCTGYGCRSGMISGMIM